ncbi:hypothetical protein AC578_4440 [Pseudocercospora eumusae]|uniref:GST N-terminal domain-containing protein n=1 Tax=Pseudocercospora eumusae TaxID=321146 RepID=A0A139HF08_9PEZI|nr:hypothetical protein AC578_4440 [Pseudocercospora eumusae]
MVLQVYLDPCTVNSRKVLAGLDLIGLQYEFNHIDYFKGEQKSESFMKINPHATVPAATDGDLTLTESNAILMYGADVAKNSSAYPTDLKLRADANRGTEMAQGRFLDARLKETGKWILPGEEPTIVDISVASPMHLYEACKLPLEQYSGIQKWLKELEKLPAWQKTQGAVDKALLPNKPSDVRAEFAYTKDLGDKLTELYFYEDPKSVGIHEPGDDIHMMSVKSAWGKNWDVDINGFALKDFQPSYNSSWEDEEKVRNEIYPEVVEFLKKELGAKRVLVFDHTIRTRKNQNKKITQENNTSQRAPVRLVHCDYTAESAPTRVRQLLPDEADHLLARRTAFINVWKPLGPVKENPLAMCDVASAPAEDFFKLYLRYRDRTGENYVMRHSDRHQWYYFPDMRGTESILLKTYDSDASKARYVGHTAFDDPTSVKDAPPRESCEIRTICFF